MGRSFNGLMTKADVISTPKFSWFKIKNPAGPMKDARESSRNPSWLEGWPMPENRVLALLFLQD